MHLVQAKTRLPRKGIAFRGDVVFKGILTHCKLGYFLLLVVGLYFPRSFFSFQTTVDFLLQIGQTFAILNVSYQGFLFL